MWQSHDEFMNELTSGEGDEEEGSALSLHNKMMANWAAKLYPSGDLSLITGAVRTQMGRMESYQRGGGGLNSNWTPLGPFDSPVYQNSGLPNRNHGTGQIHVIEFDPGYGVTNSIVYCASGFGGMFKSIDGGASWTAMGEHAFPFAPVSDIVVLDQDPQTLFVSTGGADGWNYSSGVWRSTTGGQDWEHVTVGFLSAATSFENVWSMEFLQSDPNVALIATTTGIYRSLNALAPANTVTWDLVFSAPEENYWKGLCFKTGSSNVLYASGKNVYRSTDQGGTWAPITGPDTGLDFDAAPWDTRPEVSRINVVPGKIASQAGYLYAMVNTGRNNAGAGSYVYRFDDATDSWSGGTTVNTLGDTSPGWVALAVSPLDASGQYTFAGGRLLKRSSNEHLGPFTNVGSQVHCSTPLTDRTRLWSENHKLCTHERAEEVQQGRESADRARGRRSGGEGHLGQVRGVPGHLL